MKIEGPRETRPSDLKKLRKPGSQGGLFSDMIEDSSEAHETAAPSTISLSSPVLGLQEFDSEAESRKQNLTHGKELLDQLDRIRHALLIGALPAHELQRLGSLIKQQIAATHDPVLRLIMGEIETRAAVELAKHEKLS